MVYYRLIRDATIGDLSNDFQKIIDYLLTFVGEVNVSIVSPGHAYLTYNDSPYTATLKTITNPKTTDTTISSEITLTCEKQDYLALNLIKNVTNNIGYRIFNPQISSFSPNDPNLLDLTTISVKEAIDKIFKRYHLVPLFQYRDSLLFFAKDKSGNIRLVNRHLLEYLKNNPKATMPEKEFSTVVAPDIGQFVALFDRGLIPLSFYKCLNNDIKIINLSGFNIDKFARNVIIEPIYFNLDLSRQTFVQGNAPAGIFAKKGKSLTKILKLKKYLAIKIGQDMNFVQRGKFLVPILSVSIFLDSV